MGTYGSCTKSTFDGTNNNSSEDRGVRGGGWVNTEDFLRSSSRLSVTPSDEYTIVGFRVASVPEPSAALFMLMGLGALMFKRRARRSL
jgi:formylglycine-generating enzyme required for sulfatase activity